VKGLSPRGKVKVYARNKKSLALNLRQQAERDALMDLLAQSHALIENYRPGSLEEMGLAPDALHASNPGWITVPASARTDRIAIGQASARRWRTSTPTPASRKVARRRRLALNTVFVDAD
jgi:hypothetical protein